jgi:hypothetical protein
MTIKYISGAIADSCLVKLNCSDYGDLLINHDIIGSTGCINDIPIDGETTCVLKGYDKVDDVIENLNGPAVEIHDIAISGKPIMSTSTGTSQINPSVTLSNSVSPTVSPDAQTPILVPSIIVPVITFLVILLLILAIGIIIIKKKQSKHAIKPANDSNNKVYGGNGAELTDIRPTTPSDISDATCNTNESNA